MLDHDDLKTPDTRVIPIDFSTGQAEKTRKAIESFWDFFWSGDDETEEQEDEHSA